MENNFIELKGSECVDCKIFADTVEQSAIDVVKNMVNLVPAKNAKIRCMPDIHYASPTCVVGLSMEFPKKLDIRKDLVLDPSWIGNDIGCGMSTIFLNTNCIIPKNILEEINEKLVNTFIKGNFLATPLDDHIFLAIMNDQFRNLINSFQLLDQKFIDDVWEKIKSFDDYCLSLNTAKNYALSSMQIGTIGGGNHYLEIGQNELDFCNYSITVHTGSRNLGEKIFKYYSQFYSGEYKEVDKDAVQKEITLLRESAKNKEFSSKEEKEQFFKKSIDEIYDKHTHVIEEKFLDGEHAYNYLVDQFVALCYAALNRKVILHYAQYQIFGVLAKHGMWISMNPGLWSSGNTLQLAIDSIHNYIDTFTIHKGSISSLEGEINVLPFNMKDGIAIIKGKGNEDWNCSAPHGAGRVMSRSAAKNKLDIDEVKNQMKDIVTTTLDIDTIDEAPEAYKSKDEIIKMIKPTADVIAIFKPVINIKEAEKKIFCK